jgi:hypothetical protein
MHYAVESFPLLMGSACAIGRFSRSTGMIAFVFAGLACSALNGELNGGWAASLLAISVDSLLAAAGFLTAKFVQRAIQSRGG